MDAETPPPKVVDPDVGGGTDVEPGGGGDARVIDGEGHTPQPRVVAPKRFHGSVTLNSTRVSSEAGRVAEELIAHLEALVGANVNVTLEIEAEIPGGAPENVVRIVTENSNTLKVKGGFEQD